MARNQNRKKKPVNVKDRVSEPKPKRKSTSSGTGVAQATRTTGRSKDAVQRSSAEEGPELWKVALGAIAAAGTAYGVWKHNEAKKYEVAAEQANRRASVHHADAQAATQHAQTMKDKAAQEQQRANRAEERTRVAEANATKERHRADVAESRAIKMVKEVAGLTNNRIAKLLYETAPPLRFDGCAKAATDGVEIRINMSWILEGIVDPATEEGAIHGRMIGAVAHEWFHFLDNARGTRPSHQEELLADKRAGELLARLGVPPHHFADLLRVFPQSSTHPDGSQRAETMLKAWTTWTTAETERRERENAQPITTIEETPPVTEAVPVDAQAAVRRPRKSAANKSAAKGKSTSKTGATKMSATKTATTGTPKKRAAKRSAVGRQEV